MAAMDDRVERAHRSLAQKDPQRDLRRAAFLGDCPEWRARESPERDPRLAAPARGLRPFVGQERPQLRALDVDEVLLRNELRRRHPDGLAHLNNRPPKLIANRDRTPTDPTRCHG